MPLRCNGRILRRQSDRRGNVGNLAGQDEPQINIIPIGRIAVLRLDKFLVISKESIPSDVAMR
jgi:hypothetical protein